MTKRKMWMFIVPAAILGLVLFSWIGGELVKFLWNALLPPLFGFPRVTFWQAFGLLVLCRILFGGSGLFGSGYPRRRMSDEERERFRQRIRERFGAAKESPLT